MERTKKKEGKAVKEEQPKSPTANPTSEQGENEALSQPTKSEETNVKATKSIPTNVPTEAPVKIDLDAPIWFKKIGGGSLRLRISGKPQIIPPGQKFKARPSEIPASFKDVVLPLEQIPTAETQKVVQAGKTPVFTKEKYEPKEGETFEQDMFNIVNSTGKVLNQKPLTEADADSLLKDML